MSTMIAGQSTTGASDLSYRAIASEPTPEDLAALYTEADEAAATDPIARHEVGYLTPELVEDAATWRVNVEASARRAGFATMAEYLDATDPIAEHRTATAEAPGHLVKQSRAAWYFAQMVGDHVRFDHGRARWLVWSGHRWRPDDDGKVRRRWLHVLSRRYEKALTLPDEEVRKRALTTVGEAGASNAAIEGGLAIAASMEPIATTADAWDRDPWLLCCDNGVVDLRTGRLRPGRPEDMTCRSTNISYNPDAPCPRWERFLAEVFAGDAELVEWYGLLDRGVPRGRSSGAARHLPRTWQQRQERRDWRPAARHRRVRRCDPHRNARQRRPAGW